MLFAHDSCVSLKPQEASPVETGESVNDTLSIRVSVARCVFLYCQLCSATFARRMPNHLSGGNSMFRAIESIFSDSSVMVSTIDDRVGLSIAADVGT